MLDDDMVQSEASRLALSSADQIVISRHAFCEMVWLLPQRYKMPKAEVGNVIHGSLIARNVIADTASVRAGLACNGGGRDFADGVIAHEAWLGGDTFVSFDKKAVASDCEAGAAGQIVGVRAGRAD